MVNVPQLQETRTELRRLVERRSDLDQWTEREQVAADNAIRLIDGIIAQTPLGQQNVLITVTA